MPKSRPYAAIPPVTGERDLDFVLANMQDIAALDALWHRASNDLPKWFRQMARSVLGDECRAMLHELDLHVGLDEASGASFWQRAGVERNEGPSFWLHVPSNLDWLVRTAPDTALLYAWCDRGPALNRWVEHVESCRSDLTKKGFRVLGFAKVDENQGGRTLFSQTIEDIFEPARLLDGKLRQKLAQRITGFTRLALPFVHHDGPARQTHRRRRRSSRAKGGRT